MAIVFLNPPVDGIPEVLKPVSDESYDDWYERLLSHSSREDNPICRYCFKKPRESISMIVTGTGKWFCKSCVEKYTGYHGIYTLRMELLWKKKGLFDGTH